MTISLARRSYSIHKKTSHIEKSVKILKMTAISSFLFQYRQAISGGTPLHHHHPLPSSVQSTPSKSFIAGVSSPHPLQQSPSNSSVGSQQQFLPLQQKQRSFLTFGFGAGGAGSASGTAGSGSSSRRESHVNVNVTPSGHDLAPDTPEIRKYKKRFNSEILCAALWGLLFLLLTV